MVSDSRFCVAKYEMKKDGLDNAVSTAAGSPWVNLTREKAIHLCKKMGAGFDLIFNDEWQTLARDIEQTPENWRGGPVVGSGAIQRGHSDNHPGQALSSVMDQGERTHTLSTGETIWDIAGNVWEWVQDNNFQRYEDDYIVNLEGEIKDRFGPFKNYSFQDKDGVFHRGLGFASLSFAGTGRGIIRGGAWYSGDNAGIFAVKLGFAVGASNDDIGFRCVYRLE